MTDYTCPRCEAGYPNFHESKADPRERACDRCGYDNGALRKEIRENMRRIFIGLIILGAVIFELGWMVGRGVLG